VVACHHVQGGGAGRLPRRADGEAVPDDQRTVKAAPALGPVVGDLLGRDVHVGPPCGGPQIREGGQLAGSAVDRVLDDLGGHLHLLHPAWGKLEQLGQHQLGLVAMDADGEAQQL
jgi:hypothetical protein